MGEPIKDLREIHRLAIEGKAIAFKSRRWENANIKPAAFLQNWTLETLCKFEFYYIERI